jgi:predicted MFS family arabinose efflux permease
MAMTALLSARQRSNLLLRQNGFSAALAIVITGFFAIHLLRDLLSWQDIYLLWIGVTAIALGAVCCLALRTHGVELAGRPERTLQTLRNGHAYLRTNRWLRRFLTTQLIFMSVIYSPTFYAIYAGESLSAGHDYLDDLIVFFGIGLLAGIPLWTVVNKRLGARAMYACSAAISVLAAVFCIVSQHWHLLPVLWTMGFALLLSAVATQAIRPAAYDWVFSHASAEETVMVISYSQDRQRYRCHLRQFRVQRGCRARPANLATRTGAGADRCRLPGRHASSAHHGGVTRPESLVSHLV